MKASEIIAELQKLGKVSLDYNDLLEKIIVVKKDFAQQGNEEEAKQFWIYEQIVEIHRDFNHAFNLLKEKKYFDGWCKLETVEITFHFLKKHFAYDQYQYKLYQIERAIRKLQVIFPYRIFSSIELIKKEKKCNICDKVVTVRKPCGHKTGEIYGGELCLRIVTQCDILGVALVENPVNKYTVAFIVDPDTNEKVDQYQYETVDYLMEVVASPYEPWDLAIHTKYLPHSHYNHLGQDDYCPCGSVEKYKDCCLLREGVKYLHYEFIVKVPIPKNIMSNTLKRPKNQ